ncbi:MAG: hypothetical protein ACXAEX_17065 [Promethearchaeota archaeon]|jgi:hypothetical protein
MNEKRKKKGLKFFNEAIEYFDKYSSQEILLDEEIDEENFNANFLRNEMLYELSNLSNIIESNPDFKLEQLSEEEKKSFYKFIKFYRKCPVCGEFNHYFNLKQLFFNDNKKNLLTDLIEFMNVKNEKFRNYNLNFGIPCCNCYKNLMNEY